MRSSGSVGFGLEARPNAVLSGSFLCTGCRMGEPDSLCLLALQHVAICALYIFVLKLALNYIVPAAILSLDDMSSVCALQTKSTLVCADKRLSSLS